MQKLRFERAWVRTLSIKDRDQIKQTFQSIHLLCSEPIELTTLWKAKNHRQQLLVTALVHNCSERTFSFNNKKVYYRFNETIMGEHIFTIPALIIEGKTSMPWTFIFPEDSHQQDAKLEHGFLSLD